MTDFLDGQPKNQRSSYTQSELSVNPIKIHIMAVACSGKSTFTKQNEFYQQIKIVDFGDITHKKVGRYGIILRFNKVLRQELVGLTDEIYHQKLFNYLENEPEPVATLGRIGPLNLEPYSNIFFAAVLPPIAQHIRNCSKRKLKNVKNRWGDFSNVQPQRTRLENYAKERGIPIFESFSAAIDSLLILHEEKSKRAHMIAHVRTH
jgi:hypothetical protein